MTATIRLCKTQEVQEGSPKSVEVPEHPVLAVYEVDGAYYATDNMCTHGLAMLTDGYQDGASIECPFHGGTFDICSGKATAYPCQIPLKTYPVTVEDGWIVLASPAGQSNIC